jgi:hypothetical protein
MQLGSSTCQRRETFVIVALTCLLVLAALGYFLLVGGDGFIAFLLVVGAFVVLCGLQYVLWGRAFERGLRRFHRHAPVPVPPHRVNPPDDGRGR